MVAPSVFLANSAQQEKKRMMKHVAGPALPSLYIRSNQFLEYLGKPYMRYVFVAKRSHGGGMQFA
jgi:hypothetical protein